MTNSSHLLSLLLSRVFFLLTKIYLAIAWSFFPSFSFFSPDVIFIWLLCALSFLLQFLPFNKLHEVPLPPLHSYSLLFPAFRDCTQSEIHWRSHWHHVVLSPLFASYTPFGSGVFLYFILPFLSTYSFPFPRCFTSLSPFSCPSKHRWLIQKLLLCPKPNQNSSGTRSYPWEMEHNMGVLHDWCNVCTLLCPHKPASNLLTHF